MRTWIDEVICGVLDMYETYDPFELCDRMGITLQKISSNSRVLRGQPSLYFRDLIGKERILYSDGLRYKRLKFYLLHEIGHAILHPDLIRSKLSNNGKIEAQANYFARQMIYLESGPEDTAENFAKVNDIPLRVMEDVI